MKNGGMRAIDEMRADPCGVLGVLDNTRDARTRDGGNEERGDEYKGWKGTGGTRSTYDEGGQRIQAETRMMERIRERG